MTIIYVLPTEEGKLPRALLFEAPDGYSVLVEWQPQSKEWMVIQTDGSDINNNGGSSPVGSTVNEETATAITEHAESLGVQLPIGPSPPRRGGKPLE